MSEFIEVAGMRITKSPDHPPLTNYAVLFDPTAEQLRLLSEALPDVMIWSFFTKPDGEIPDFGSLNPQNPDGRHKNWIMPPFYIGNVALAERRQLVDRIIAERLV